MTYRPGTVTTREKALEIVVDSQIDCIVRVLAALPSMMILALYWVWTS